MNDFSSQDIDERITTRFRKSRLWLLTMYAVAMVPLSILASQIDTDNAIERWLGDSNPSIRKFDKFRETFDVRPQLTAVVENISPTDLRIENYATELESLSFVHSVLTPLRLAERMRSAQNGQIDSSGSKPMPRAGLLDSMESTQDRVVSSVDFLRGTPIGKFFVPEGKSTMLRIDLTPEALQNSQECVETVRSKATAIGIPQDHLHLGGAVVINAALDRQSRDSLKFLVPLVAVVCGLSLWFLVGKFWRSILILFSASLSVVATLGFMSLAGESLNLLSIALPPLIGVLHLSVGIHLLHQFNEAARTPADITDTKSHPKVVAESRNRRTVIPALGYSVRKTLPPSFLATITTVIGMVSLMVSDLQPVRSFGMWAAIGILLSLVVAYTFVPCFLLGSQSVISKPMRCRWISPAFRRTRATIFTVSLVLLAVSLLGWTQLKPEFNAISFLSTNSRTMHDYRWIENRCCGLVPIEFIIDLNNQKDSMARRAEIEVLSQRLDDHPAVTHVLNVSSFLPTVRGSKSIAATGRPAPFNKTFENWVSRDGNRFRISALVRSDYPEDLGKLSEELRSRITDAPVEVTGLISLIDRSQHAIYASLRDSLLMACLLISLLLMIVLRSISAGLIVLIPNILPIVVGFGLISWMGMPLDIGTVVTASIALGIALDDSLHFLHHFRHFAKSPRRTGKSLRMTWKICSWPMFQTSYVAIVGFLVLATSSFRPIAHFGGLMVTMLSLALAADLVLLPYLLTTPLSRLFRSPA